MRGNRQRCAYQREIPREFIPRYRSGATRNPLHDLLQSPHRGRRVFDIPGLSPLAFGPNPISISLDPVFLLS